ncbi:hypothetical protein SAE02_69060 [Skermanella aerolata]|uniref:Uncharacterized protein n=1 Tax=Skermanella aerolata TaxID=393310 RepID=A0A512E204_9PROT|nr:hypothetical protein SAE02_69060 [Skermanella aerolata]
MVFKLTTAATKAWRHLWGENQLPKINQSITFRDGTEVFDPLTGCRLIGPSP